MKHRPLKHRPRPLDQQVMVITGASSGIGLATARKAAAAGASVMLVSRNGVALSQVCDEIRAKGGSAHFAVADVGVADEVRAVARAAVERFGRIDSWINGAGVAIYAPLERTPEEEHDRLFRTNYWGVVNGALAALPYLKTNSNGGALITIGSIVGDFGVPVQGAYAASKHAVKGFINSLRIELIAERAPGLGRSHQAERDRGAAR